jgi:hypothetical protein
MKEFLNKVDGHILIGNAWKPKLLRKNDMNIMERVLSTNMSKDNIRTFNNWRLYYQVINLSEITTMDGSKIQEIFLLKKEAKQYKPTSKIRWPIQAMPHINTFILWKQTIEHLSGCKHDGRQIHRK